MSFNDYEVSTQDGRPVALYTLRWGKTYWRYTSADRNIERIETVGNTLEQVEYVAMAMRDNGMTQGSSSQNDFTVQGPSNLPIVDLFRGTPPSESIWLTVRRMHIGDTDAPITWKGLVLNVVTPDPARCEIVGKPLIATLKRTGLRLCWTRECPHYLYDRGCKVDPESYAVLGEVTSIAGSDVTLALAEPPEAGYFLGGFMAWEVNADGTPDRRMIELDSEAGGERLVRVMGLADRLAVGTEVKLYPGCTRLPDVCDGRFNNLANYGGVDFMPGETPFSRPIW